jgi:hypothetical protein
MPATKVTQSAERVRRHRQSLRQQGLKPLQIWVPDVALPSFAEAARAQSRVVAESAAAIDDQAFIDVVSELSDE